MAGPEQPKLIAKRVVYEGFTTLSIAKLQLRDGSQVEREIEDHGACVAVLPYDPVRRTTILVRLLRAPVLIEAGKPALLEAIAGMIDEGDPAQTARREAMEEAGLRLGALEHVGTVWTSPGLSTERMHLFLAPYSEHDRVAAGGGLAEEHEGISVVEMPLQELWSLHERGALDDIKTLTLLLLLKVRYPALFGA